MKECVLEFIRRGFAASSFGPIVLAVLYLAFKEQTGLQTLSVDQVCVGILSVSALAFVAGGMNIVYQIERLPLMIAILIHGVVLYFSYLVTYLVNDWLEWGTMPVLVFTGIFVIGYLLIWVVIYSVMKKKTDKINQTLRKKQLETEHRD